MKIQNLISNGAEGIILGCTEIPLLIKQEDVEVPLFDTTTIHAKSAVENALKKKSLLTSKKWQILNGWRIFEVVRMVRL